MTRALPALEIPASRPQEPEDNAAILRMLTGAAVEARMWLFNQAMPLWTQAGQHQDTGLFYTAITQSGAPVMDQPRLASVQALQICAVCEAGRLGWTGPWEDRAGAALEALNDRFTRADGTIRATFSPGDTDQTDHWTTEDQGYVLLALAHANRAGFGPVTRTAALQIMTVLLKERRHPIAGFEETMPRSLPLRASTHLPLLEAMLTWSAIDDIPLWREAADTLVNLCMNRFVDSVRHCLFETFDGAWQPGPALSTGSNTRAGDTPEAWETAVADYYEWAWLLNWWGRQTRNPMAHQTMDRLYGFAERHGVGPDGVTVATALSRDGIVTRPHLSPQPLAGRLLAGLVMARDKGTDRPQYGFQPAQNAWTGLQNIMNASEPGLWRETISQDGAISPDPSDARTLYRIVRVVTALSETVQGPTASADEPSAGAETGTPSHKAGS